MQKYSDRAAREVVMIGTILGLSIQRMNMLSEEKIDQAYEHVIDSLHNIGVNIVLEEIKTINKKPQEEALATVIKIKSRIIDAIGDSCGSIISDWFELTFSLQLLSTTPEELSNLDIVIFLEDIAIRVGFDKLEFAEIVEELKNGDNKIFERFLDHIMKQKERAKIGDTRKIKILFLGANPSSTSRLKLGEEIKKIQTNLKLAKERDNLELKQEWAVTIETLMQAILDETPNIVHFSGHGGKEGIILQNEIGESKTVSTDALESLFKLFKDSVKSVVLNSCYSEHQAKVIRLHIPYVIGMKAGIPDKTAISFSTGFYKAIGAGRDIPFAFELGITAIKLEGGAGDNIPILL